MIINCIYYRIYYISYYLLIFLYDIMIRILYYENKIGHDKKNISLKIITYAYIFYLYMYIMIIITLFFI